MREVGAVLSPYWIIDFDTILGRVLIFNTSKHRCFNGWVGGKCDSWLCSEVPLWLCMCLQDCTSPWRVKVILFLVFKNINILAFFTTLDGEWSVKNVTTCCHHFFITLNFSWFLNKTHKLHWSFLDMNISVSWKKINVWLWSTPL